MSNVYAIQYLVKIILQKCIVDFKSGSKDLPEDKKIPEMIFFEVHTDGSEKVKKVNRRFR